MIYLNLSSNFSHFERLWLLELRYSVTEYSATTLCRINSSYPITSQIFLRQLKAERPLSILCRGISGKKITYRDGHTSSNFEIRIVRKKSLMLALLKVYNLKQLYVFYISLTILKKIVFVVIRELHFVLALLLKLCFFVWNFPNWNCLNTSVLMV